MNNSIPTTEEMRILVKNIYETGQKVSGNIQIETLDDAANFAAYLYGFNSWKEYRGFLKKNHTLEKKRKNLPVLPNFKKRSARSINLRYEKLKSSKEPQLVQSQLLPLEWLMGKKKNIYAKVEEPIGLLSENYLVTSTDQHESRALLNLQFDWLNTNRQMYVLFNMDKKTLHTLNVPNHTLIIGQENIKIDPLFELLDSDGFEMFFNDDENHFSWLWTLLIRTMKEEQKIQWSAALLMETISLDYLVDIRDKLKQTSSAIIPLLEQYLFKQCGVVQEENQYVFSEQAQAHHYQQVLDIRAKLEQMNFLYESGYFASILEKNTISIKQSLFEKQSMVIVECEEKSYAEIYNDLTGLVFIAGMKKHNKLIKMLNPRQYMVWSIVWQAEKNFSEMLAHEFTENNEALISGAYLESDRHNLNSWFENTRQIVFLNQSNFDYPPVWRDKALDQTKLWEHNFWHNNREILKQEIKKAYLWKPMDILNMPVGIEDYHFISFDLYEKNVG